MGPKTRECHIQGMCTSTTTPPLFGVGVGLRLVAACRNSYRDMYIVCIFIGSAIFIKILNDFILWVMFLKANTCILFFVKAKYLQNYVSSIKELSGENTIYRLKNKYSLLKTRFRNDNSYTLTFK